MKVTLQNGTIYKNVVYKAGELIEVDDRDLAQFGGAIVQDNAKNYDDDLVIPASEGLPALDTTPKKGKRNV